jgi:hypothetical protein
MRYAIAALFIVSVFGCSDDVPDQNPGDADATNNGLADMGGQDTAGDVPEDVEDVSDEPDTPMVQCEPNSILRCLQENAPGVERCNFRGNQTFLANCEGRAVCRTIDGVPTCVEVECIPGQRVCLDEDTPGVCDDEGSGYQAQEQCGEGVTCSAGACLDPCEIADEAASYIGCEYWPVELDNNLLFDEDENSTANAPFAVVLSNPQQETALITVRTPEGTIMDALTEVNIPGQQIRRDEGCTFDIECGRNGQCVGGICLYPPTVVRTEVLDADGERVGEPISGPMENVEVPPGGQLQIPFPRMQPEPYKTSLSRIAWHIVADRPVVAYQFNPICCNFSFTNDASILLPTGALTKDYYALTYPTWNHPQNTNVSIPATLTIVATEDDTDVTVFLGDRQLRPSTDPRLDGQPADGVIRVNLDRQEVLNIETADMLPTDLTGAKIETSKPVAVFGGHACTFIPFHQWACDHIEQQLFPSETWGRNYILAPLKLRGPGAGTREATYWKFLARKDGTEITLDRNYDDLDPLAQSAEPAATPSCRDKLTRTNIISLNDGEFCEFGTRIGLSVDSNHPILVGAFMSGQFSTGMEDFGNQAGDPAFFLVPPQEQYRREYDVLTPPTYALDYVTVIIQPNSNLMIDGVPVDPMDHDPEYIESQNHIRAHIPLDDGPHHLEADVPFGIVVYAYDDFVSYAYTGGLNLTKLPEERE